ncbi:MAG: MmcQ/YjbR family DNA-binding protein [Christensenellaceae bacterium]
MTAGVFFSVVADTLQPSEGWDVSVTRQELIEYCLTYQGAVEDYPFEDRNTTIMRHANKGKWFAAIFEREENLCISLKCEPMEADFLRSAYKAVTPAWHFNKTHWNTVTLGGDVPKQELLGMIKNSFDLTRSKHKQIR